MKESDFIEQNKEKWLEFENNLLQKNIDPSKTSKLFVQITEDLSYARTFYKNRSVRLYLNGIAKVLFNDINKTRRSGWKTFAAFWTTDLPLSIYKARRAMLISFTVFVTCFILGVVTSIQNKEFAAMILSKDYVNMTNENIAKGDAMAVYKSQSEMRTFLPILLNNLRVDFLTFFSGVFMAIGTLVVMVYNGIMVGVFQYFFIERGLFWESFLGIWTHGALEIPTIILSGGAGLTLGKGLLFPGTYTRFQAFKLSGMTGLKILLGVAPVTFLAAFIEGFITRHTSIPDPIRFIFILLSFTLVLLYFYFYPKRVAKQHKKEQEKPDAELIYKQVTEFNPTEIYSANKLIAETFRQLFKHFGFFFKFVFFAALAGALLTAYNPLQLFHDLDYPDYNLNNLFNYDEFPPLGVFFMIAFTCMAVGFLYLISTQIVNNSQGETNFNVVKPMVSAIFCSGLFTFIIYTDITLCHLLAFVLFPLLVLVTCISQHMNLHFYEAFSEIGSLFAQSFGKFLGINLVFTIIAVIIYWATTAALRVLFVQDALSWVLTDNEASAGKIQISFMAFQAFLSFFIYVLLLILSNSLLFFTMKETYSAEHLISRIQNITANKK